MVKETLVALTQSGRLPTAARVAGRRIVDFLEERNIEVTAAFWSFQEEAEAWRLSIATPAAISEGPLSVYRQLQEVLKDLFPVDAEKSVDIELSDIAVINPNARIVADLRRRYGIVPQEDVRLVGQVDGPYIYRLV